MQAIDPFQAKLEQRMALPDCPQLVRDFIRIGGHRMKSPKSKVDYVNELIQYNAFREFGDFDALKPQDLRDYINWRSDNSPNGELSIASRNKITSVLRTFFDYLEEMEMVKVSPAKRVKTMAPPLKPITVFTDRELILILEGRRLDGTRIKFKNDLDRYRWHAIMRLMIETGMRNAEVRGIDIEDINLDYRTIWILRKGNKEQKMGYGEYSASALRRYYELRKTLVGVDDKPFFLSATGERIGYMIIQRMMKDIGADRKDVSSHTARKTYATILYNATGDIKLVADSLETSRAARLSCSPASGTWPGPKSTTPGWF